MDCSSCRSERPRRYAETGLSRDATDSAYRAAVVVNGRPVRPGDGALISARHSMATATSLIVGSVDRAVTAGWHDGVSPNRLRRSSTESFWMSMNSAVVINRVTASRMSLILALTARVYKPAAEDR